MISPRRLYVTAVAILGTLLVACPMSVEPQPTCERLSCSPCEDEANDSQDSATLTRSGNVSGHLCAGDVDWYALSVSAGEELVVSADTANPVWAEIWEADADAPIASGLLLDGVRPLSTFALIDGALLVVFRNLPGQAEQSFNASVEVSSGALFLSPDGDDAADGSFAAPWRTLNAAGERLTPGSTLALLPGTYDRATYDDNLIDCGAEAVSGTAADPIRLTAAREREAHILGQFGLYGCDHWSIEGLRLEGRDHWSESRRSLLRIHLSNQILVRRNLLSNPNRTSNTHVMTASRSSDVLFEENEIYDYHRASFLADDTERVTLRRNYSNSRGYPSVLAGDPIHPEGTAPEDGYDASYDDRGDVGIYSYNGNSEFLVENHFDEGSGLGIEAGGTVGPHGVFGSIVVEAVRGFLAAPGLTPNEGVIFDNCVSIRSQVGFSGWSSEGTVVNQCSSFDGSIGFDFRLAGGSVLGDVSISNSLAAGHSSLGFSISDQSDWSIRNSLAFQNAEGFQPADSENLIDALEFDPLLNGCRVAPPEGSSVLELAGGTVGATIVYRTEDGVVTNLPLWSPMNGGFPCGAVVSGVNDDPITSCIGAHIRAQVGVGDCRVPR